MDALFLRNPVSSQLSRYHTNIFVEIGFLRVSPIAAIVSFETIWLVRCRSCYQGISKVLKRIALRWQKVWEYECCEQLV
ncbi:hypothetical protein [Microcoleus sp. T2B6]|uniref:hypothetical protein n=1 Tax=Microcoleus sp. T2B6 TaxID=3055424 RepID=UPI002FD01ADB